LDPGSWILDPGSRISWIQDPDPGSWIQDPGPRILDPGSRRSWIQDPGSRIQEPGSWILQIATRSAQRESVRVPPSLQGICREWARLFKPALFETKYTQPYIYIYIYMGDEPIYG